MKWYAPLFRRKTLSHGLLGCCKRNVVLYRKWAVVSFAKQVPTSGDRVGKELVAIGTFINTLMRMVAMSKNKYIHHSKQLKLNNISMITRSGFCHGRVMECFSTTGARAPAAATSSPSTSSTATSSSHTTSVAEWPGSPPWGQSSHSARAHRGL